MHIIADRLVRGIVRPGALVLALLVACVVVLLCRPARAEPWFGWGQNAIEDRFADGDFDEDDPAARSIARRPGVVSARGQSWLTLGGFRRDLLSGKTDLGAFVVLGLALDRVSAGPVHRIEEGAAGAGPASAPSTPAATSNTDGRVTALARQCVAAAWREAGIEADDARIESMIARSRTSALLPEARTRAMRLWNDASHTTTLTTSDGTSFYDAIGANLVLEVRLTWRLDRLLYADDEPTLERIRIERRDARTRVATRTLDALFAWRRAQAELERSAAGSREALEAAERLAEAEATLDVLTGGWFSQREAERRATSAEGPKAAKASRTTDEPAGPGGTPGTPGTPGRESETASTAGEAGGKAARTPPENAPRK